MSKNKMKDRNLSEKESLAIITLMIQKARANLHSKMTPSVFLLWGYTTVLIGVVIIIFNIANVWGYQSLLWLLVPLICYPRIIYYSIKRENFTPSYIDKSVNYISLLYIAICSSVAVATLWSIFPVFFIEGLLISMWAVSIGVLIKFKKFIYSGIVGIIISHLFLVIDDINHHLIVFIAIIVVAIIIPGHLFSNSVTEE